MDMQYSVLAVYGPQKLARDTYAKPTPMTRQDHRKEESTASFHEMLDSAYRRERREVTRLPERHY